MTFDITSGSIQEWACNEVDTVYFFAKEAGMVNVCFFLKASSCCQYGSKGVKTGGFDCLIIPGAEKKTAAATNLLVGECQGGGGMGLGSVVDAKAAVTICCTYSEIRGCLILVYKYDQSRCTLVFYTQHAY